MSVPGESPTRDMDTIKPLMQLVLHMTERVRRLKLSKEVRTRTYVGTYACH